MFLEKQQTDYLEFYFVKELTPPCTVALDVEDDTGEVLYTSGDTLEEQDLEVLEEHGVEQVIVRRNEMLWTVVEEPSDEDPVIELTNDVPDWLKTFFEGGNLYQFTENLASFLDQHGRALSDTRRKEVTDLLESSLMILRSLHELNLRLRSEDNQPSINEIIQGDTPDNDQLNALPFEQQKEMVEALRLRNELTQDTAEFVRSNRGVFSRDSVSGELPESPDEGSSNVLKELEEQIVEPISEGLLTETERKWAKDVLDTPVVHEDDPEMTYLFTKTQQFLENFLFRGVVLESMVDELLEFVEDDILTDERFFRRLSFPSEGETYLLSHIVNVLIMSIYLARNMGHDFEFRHRLIIASLFHDIGMLKTDPSQWAFNLDYHDDMKENISRHPVLSKRLMESVPYLFDPEIKDAVLNHHERLDGSGYPNGIEGEEISALTRLLTVADVYEAMSTPRPYRSAIRCDRIIKYLKNHPDKFDQDIVTVLEESLGAFPVGTVVRLNTREIGVVLSLGNDPYQPKVKVIVDPEGDVYESPKTEDLSESDRTIEETLGSRGTSQALLQSM